MTRNALIAVALIAALLAGGCCSVPTSSSSSTTPQATIVTVTPGVPANASERQLLSRIDTLEQQNAELRERLDQQNISIRSYEEQLSFYRVRFGNETVPAGASVTGTGAIRGSASLEAPAVLQRSVYEREGPFVYERTEQTGSLLNVTVEIVPGRGRVLVNTTPLMGEVFQDAANTAAFVAQKETGRDLSTSDVIVSIVAEDEVPAVDGGSAGALMTLLMISAIQNTQPREDVILTGTIDQDGRVGAIGGVVDKATAAEKAGKSLFLIPRENNQIVRYTERTVDYYGYEIVQRVPERVDAKQYLESVIGIRAEYVDTIDDVVRLAR